VITVANGRTTQDITFNLVDKSSVTDATGKPTKAVTMPMTFQGDINLINLQQLLKVSLPPQLIGKFIPDRKAKDTIVKIFPNGIPITMKGTTTKPQVDAGDIGKQMVSGFAKSELNNVIPGANGGGGKGNGLGGLLNQITGQGQDQSQQSPDQST